MWTRFWNRPKRPGFIPLGLVLTAVSSRPLFMQRCASVCASWDNKSVEPQQSHEKNISGMQFVQWELILCSTLSDNFHRKCRWDCGMGMRLMRLHFSVPRNYVMSPFLWEPSESVSCPVFGLTLRTLASSFSSLGFVFFVFCGSLCSW